MFSFLCFYWGRLYCYFKRLYIFGKLYFWETILLDHREFGWVGMNARILEIVHESLVLGLSQVGGIRSLDLIDLWLFSFQKLRLIHILFLLFKLPHRRSFNRLFPLHLLHLLLRTYLLYLLLWHKLLLKIFIIILKFCKI